MIATISLREFIETLQEIENQLPDSAVVTVHIDDHDARIEIDKKALVEIWERNGVLFVSGV